MRGGPGEGFKRSWSPLINEMDESVVITVVSGAGYDLGAAIAASATIKSSGEIKISGAKMSAVGGFGFKAMGFPNRPYRIDARTPTSGWVPWMAGVCGADGSIVYQENFAASAQCLFYRVVCE